MVKIVLDPGHGCLEKAGYDFGAVGRSGVREGDVALDIAQKLAGLLAEQGHDVQMTRFTETLDTESVDSLQYRCNVSNGLKADLFISIHCNSFDNPAAKGTETWYYPGSDDGQRLAQAIHNEMVQLGLADRGIKADTPLTVLGGTEAVAVLVETAFISNPDEEALLASDEFRQRIADAIHRGIYEYGC